MSTNKDRTQGRAQSGPLRTAILLALPLLSLQRDLLQVIKAGLEKPTTAPANGDGVAANDSIADVLQKYAARQLQALMMLVDPAHTWRNGLGEDFYKKLESDISYVSQRVASGAITLIEAQSKILERVVEALRQIK